MKKLWISIISILIVLLVFFLNKNLLIFDHLFRSVGIQTSSERRINKQSWDIFTLENLPRLEKLNEISQQELINYTKKYISKFGSIASRNKSCPENITWFYMWEDFVCFNWDRIEHELSFWFFWTWNREKERKFIQRFWTFLDTIWNIELRRKDWNICIIAKLNANPETFKIINEIYAKDDKYVYVYGITNGKQLSWVDLKTFEALKYGAFTAKDKKNVYYYDNVITWVDIKTIETVWQIYSKDKNRVYIFWSELSWADSKTFEYFSSWDITARDKNWYYYEFGQRAENYNPNAMDISNDIEETNILEDVDPYFTIERINVDSNKMLTDKIVNINVSFLNNWSSIKKDYFLHLYCEAINPYWDYLFFSLWRNFMISPSNTGMFSTNIEIPITEDVLIEESIKEVEKKGKVMVTWMCSISNNGEKKETEIYTYKNFSFFITK